MPDAAGALVVVPTLNEAANLPELTRRVFAAVPGAHLLIVDDRSPDGTGQLAEALAADDPRLRVLHRDGPRGLGRAYLAGFGWALDRGYGVVVEMDADLSHDPAALPGLIGALSAADLAVGARYGPGGGGVADWPLHRRLLSRGANALARHLAGVPLSDATSGFRAYRREALLALDLPEVRSNGYAFQVELAARAARAGLRLVEVPICFVDRARGDSKLRGADVIEGAAMVGRLTLARAGAARGARGR
jgi:glycosyltransferase involved in cell wall biosynthesis